MLRGWGFRFVLNKGPSPLWSPIRGKIRKMLINLQKILLMNHWPECIDIWHGTFLGQGDSSLFK